MPQVVEHVDELIHHLSTGFRPSIFLFFSPSIEGWMVALRSEPGALFLILFLWNFQLVLAGIVNRTIDDGFGDSDTLRKVTYLPTTSSVWQNASCTGCSIRPDTSRAFKGTYTAATYNPQLGSMSITMKFNGKLFGYLLSISSSRCQFITPLLQVPLSMSSLFSPTTLATA